MAYTRCSIYAVARNKTTFPTISYRPTYGNIVNISHTSQIHCWANNTSFRPFKRIGGANAEQEAQLTLWVADVRTAPSHTSTITRYVFERSTRSVDKRSSYLRELVWQPSWQLDNCPDRLNCASVYTVNCELCTASANGQCPRQATPMHCGRVVHSTVVKYLTTFRT